MQSDIVLRLDDWRSEMQRTIKALESNPKFADVVEGNRAIYTTLGMAKTEILFSRTTIANQAEAMRASDAEITRLTEALRAAEEREKALREFVEMFVKLARIGTGNKPVARSGRVNVSADMLYIAKSLVGAKP